MRAALFGIAAVVSLVAVCICFGLMIGFGIVDDYEAGNMACRAMIIEGCIFFGSCIGLNCGEGKGD